MGLLKTMGRHEKGVFRAVSDLPLPGPWARLKFRALSVKIEACGDTPEPHNVGSRGPVQGVQRAKPTEALGFYGILSAKITV